MNQREMLMYDNEYKKSVLAIMNTIVNTRDLPNKNSMSSLRYYKVLNDTIIRSMECNEDIQKDSRIYKLVKKYLPVLLYIDIEFGRTFTIYKIAADMLYNTNDPSLYNKIDMSCTIVEEDDKFMSSTKVEIRPSIRLLYNNIGVIYELSPVVVYNNKDIPYSFYRIYIDTKIELKSILENEEIKSSISKLIDTDYLIQEMAMLITLAYMKSIIPIKDYSKFLKMDEEEDKEDTSIDEVEDLEQYDDIWYNIYDINISLYKIASADISVLKKTLRKINNIIKHAKEEVIEETYNEK